jgi:hypothetical protein
MKALKLPPTIRTPRLDEVPQRPETIQKIRERQLAKIVEGYTINDNDSKEYPFKFYAEVNIDNENLWLILKTLIMQLPDEISLIYGHIDNDPAYSEYLDKYALLNHLEPFKTELTQDGFLEFGVIFQVETFMVEIFIKKAKYIQYWGMDKECFRKTMNDYGIYEIQDLNFIDEYPLMTESLRLYKSDILETNALLDHFDTLFNNKQKGSG